MAQPVVSGRVSPRLSAVAAGVGAGLDASPTPSYWIEHSADTDPTRLAAPPPLPAEADYVIIGGGMTGVSTAYFLAKLGLSSVVVEGRTLAGGATGRNGGVLSGSSVFHKANIEMLKGIMAEQGIDCEYRLGGYLRVAFEGSADAADYAAAELGPAQELWDAARCATELKTEQVDGLKIACASAVRTMHQPLTPPAGTQCSDSDLSAPFSRSRSTGPCVGPSWRWLVAGGIFNEDSGHFWPAKCIHAIAKGAGDKVTFCLHTAALGLTAAGPDSGVMVETDRGLIKAKRVAVCTNGWAPRLLPELAEVLYPVRNGVIMTAPVKAWGWQGSISIGDGPEEVCRRGPSAAPPSAPPCRQLAHQSIA